MPKEKRKRTPLHAKAATRANGLVVPFNTESQNSTHSNINETAAVVQEQSTKLHPSDLNLPHLTKREKRNLKRAEFLSKLDSTHNSKRIAALHRKEAQKKLKVDLNPLTASLPKLFALPEEQSHMLHASSQVKASTIHPKIGQSSKGVKSQKARKKIAAQEMQRFNAVLQHPAFRQNPLQTIHQHTQNTLVKRAGASTRHDQMIIKH